mmetsp:Transcript_498/g.1967  ORF Transcript_498/g.1967 Transcript_498/m.1967 type:complete len:209 (+) Transcript_498:3576-4202(+)
MNSVTTRLCNSLTRRVCRPRAPEAQPVPARGRARRELERGGASRGKRERVSVLAELHENRRRFVPREPRFFQFVFVIVVIVVELVVVVVPNLDTEHVLRNHKSHGPWAPRPGGEPAPRLGADAGGERVAGRRLLGFRGRGWRGELSSDWRSCCGRRSRGEGRGRSCCGGRPRQHGDHGVRQINRRARRRRRSFCERVRSAFVFGFGFK